MYSYIKGTLEEVFEDHIVVDNHGIGYNIYIPLRMMDELPPKGTELKVITYLQVREDMFSLFGFRSYDELHMFKLLINVSGIGPKGGLAILSIMSPNDIRFAVASGDAKAIAKAPGVGSKTAQKVIIELKDKVDLEDALNDLEDSNVPNADTGANNQVKKEAIEALVALGYSNTDSAKIISSLEITADTTVEDVLKAALKNMAFM